MNLDPVRAALVADARERAAGLRSAAQRDADAAIAAAHAEADRLLERARAEGEAEARREMATETARLRRQSRERVLAAQRHAGERLRDEARRAASALREDAAYPAVIVPALVALARRQLGPGAAVTVDEEAGGVVAETGDRSVDYRLPAIADRCLAALGPAREVLWR
jgi:hypothetical protein